MLDTAVRLDEWELTVALVVLEPVLELVVLELVLELVVVLTGDATTLVVLPEPPPSNPPSRPPKRPVRLSTMFVSTLALRRSGTSTCMDWRLTMSFRTSSCV